MIERIQSSLAKFALGVSSNAPNLCAQSELGLKPFRQALYERQLGFYRRILFLEDKRWVKIALLDHLSCTWSSPYLAHICDIRSKLKIFGIPTSEKLLKYEINNWFLDDVNTRILQMNLPCLSPLEYFKRASYVCESDNASILAQFKLGVAGLGNRQPLPLVSGSNYQLCATLGCQMLLS